MADIKIETMEYLIECIKDNAREAVAESRKDRSNLFAAGRSLAYYEVLDMIKSRLEVRDIDLASVGLDINLDKEFI